MKVNFNTNEVMLRNRYNFLHAQNKQNDKNAVAVADRKLSTIPAKEYSQMWQATLNMTNPISFGRDFGYKSGMFIILDGFGVRDENAPGNPFKDAYMPFYKSLLTNAFGDTLYRTIEASGVHVGLPEGMVGNSEVGHNNLGAGRFVPQDLLVIDSAIKDGSFKDNIEFSKAMLHANDNHSTLHIMGLLSDGYVHSSTQHFRELIKMAHDNGVESVKVHAFLDGRDVDEGTGVQYIESMNEYLKSMGYSEIASVIGMQYPMDREAKWDKTQVAYRMLLKGDNATYAKDAVQQVKDFYGKIDSRGEKIQDRSVPPIITPNFQPISDNDAVIFANYRPDRAIQITDAITQQGCIAPFLKDKNNPRQPKNLRYVCMSMYEPSFDLPVAFPPLVHSNTITQVLSDNGVLTYVIAEAPKRAHVTYFLDGKRHTFFANESLHIVPSKSGKITPEMKLNSLLTWLKTAINDEDTKFAITNFANADMIGHTGDYDMGVKTLEELSHALAEVVTLARERKFPVVITADHGNIEDLSNENGKHTNNPVPFIVVLPGKEKDIASGKISLNYDDKSKALKDVAPTILDLMNLDKPEEMTGETIIEYDEDDNKDENIGE